jgi:TolB protein
LVNYGDQIVTTNESAGPNNWQVSVVLTVPKDAFGVQPMQSTTSQRYVVETVDGVQVVKDTWPLRPGEPHKIVIAYYLPYHDRAVITHSFPDRVVDAAVLVPNDTIRFQSDQFDLEGEWRYRRAGDKYIPLPADVVVDPSTDFSLIKEHKLLAPLPPETPLIITLTGIAGGDADVTMLPPGLISGALLFNLMQLGNAEIQMIRLDDGQISTLASSPYAELCPHWSPDGTQIVFVSKRDSDPDIYGLTLGDGQVSRLTDKSGSEWSPVWSPDGSQIAFVADYIVNEDIYVIRADGSQRHLLTVSFSDDWNPAWSPDGTQIAFETTRDGNSEIYVMNADGSDPRNLTNNPANDWLPAWSPDGSQIAFVSMRDGNANIYVMNADGSGQHRLIDHPAGEYYPAWSPDGQWLAFTSNRTGATEIYVMALDSGALYRVTDAGVDNAWLSWQPAPAP